MARPPKLTPEQIEEAARDLARGGATLASLAERFGVSAPGLSQALKRRRESTARRERNTPPPARQPDSEADAPVDPARLPQVGDVAQLDLAASAAPLTREEQKAFFGRVLRQGELQYRALLDAGEIKEARQVLAATIQASAALLRLEKIDGIDNLTLSKEELEARRERVKRTMMTYLATKRPLLCAHCNRELGVAWGRGEKGAGET